MAALEENVIVSLLKQLNIDAPTIDHVACYTVEEQAEHLSVIPGVLTKNLFVKDKKYGAFLITTAASQEVNMKVVASMLNLSGANLRFADEPTLQEMLGVTRGSVSPFALLFDKDAGAVKFCIDKNLMEAPLVNFHPLQCDKTTSVTPAQLTQFLEHVNHAATILDFSKAPTVAAGPPPSKKSGGAAAAPKVVAKVEKVEKIAPTDGSKFVKKETMLGLSAKKSEDFATWYTQAITLSEMIDYSDISGCYILRPWSYFIWESIQKFMDERIKALGVQNTYFPLFVSEKALCTEKDHIEGFAAEVAWVTKSGQSELAEPIAVRPTSETIMYPFFQKWIRSHRDLPLKINQWSNVVRWEFKDATPFIRSREFLWQEGHTAHMTYEESQDMVRAALDMYESTYQDLLAVPVIKGMKTEKEKFAGALHTTTVEAYINGSGKAIQGATSHNLGQNFGKMFKINYENDVGEKAIPWQTSWGYTTRAIGVAVMVHGDDKGLVLPPRVAPIQVIICPISMKKEGSDASEYTALLAFADSIHAVLKARGIRVDVDARQNYTAGWKYNHWEQKGVPLRVEIGPRDFANKSCRLVRRDNGEKSDVSVEGIDAHIAALLDTIHDDMLRRATEGRDAKLVKVHKWEDFVPALERHCLVLTPFCDETEWEEKVKHMSRNEALNGAVESDTAASSVAAKTLCKPFDQPELPEGTPCFVSGKPATTWVLWGRSY